MASLPSIARSGARLRAAMALVALAALVGCLALPSAGLPFEVRVGPGPELAFDPDRVVAQAGSRLVLTLVNTSSEPHNLTLVEPVGAATRSIVRAGQSDTIVFTVPPPGSYRFVCTIHPGMEGLLEVE